MTRRERTAHHEASHAVVARLLGIDVISISIEPDHDSNGRVIRERWPASHQSVLVAMAGPIGEGIFTGKPGGSPGGRLGDSKRVREEMAALGTSAHRWVVYQAASRRLVRMHWRTIRAVAAELLRHDHGRMNGYCLDRLIAASQR